MKKRAVVLLSGGLDSLACLHVAKDAGYEVHALTVSYGQQHAGEEIRAARDIGKLFEARHAFIDCSAITKALAVRTTKASDPVMPHRNALLLTLAAMRASAVDSDIVFFGANAADHDDFPDCRLPFIHSLMKAWRQGSDFESPVVHTPLISMTKAAIFAQISAAGLLPIALECTRTCYAGKGPRHEWGYGCGKCAACKTRRAGYESFKEAQS